MADIIPDPAVYEGETAQALHAYQNALNAISARRSNTLQNFGFTAQVDPTTGQLNHYSIDQNNQFGQIQQLMGVHQAEDQSVQHADVARGIGTLGLGAQQLARVRMAHAAGTQNLGRQFVGEIGQESNDQLSALQGYNEAKVQAQRDALLTAIQNGWFTPVQQSNDGSGIGGGGGGNMFANGGQPDPFTNLNNLSGADWQKIANLPVNRNVVGTKNASQGFFRLNPVAARGI